MNYICLWRGPLPPAGGEIDGTSKTTMGFCGSGDERYFEAMYFHPRG